MAADDDTQQTMSFQLSDRERLEYGSGDPVHVLLLLDDNAPPRRIPLHSLPVVIGRNPPADLILDGPTVSRRHCRLELVDGRLRLGDLGSTNGTFVNGARATEPVSLDEGAVLGIGIHRLRYHRRAQDETAEADALEQEWREASQYVSSIVPRPINEGPVRANWFYQPSTRIGGDAFGYQMHNQRHFSLFLLDVSGHGTGAAMHAIAVAQVLRERVLPDVDFLDPAAVIGGLNARFQMHRNNDLFFTIWYGVYDIVDRILVFAAAGHHPAYLLPADNGAWPALALHTQNPIVGMLPDPAIATADVEVPPGSTLHLFSDGVFEIVDRQGRQLGLDDILPMLPSVTNARWVQGDIVTPDEPRILYDRIRTIARPGALDDDFSALVFRFP